MTGRHQYSCLENSLDERAWQATVHGGPKELDVTEPLTYIDSSSRPSCVARFGSICLIVSPQWNMTDSVFHELSYRLALICMLTKKGAQRESCK